MNHDQMARFIRWAHHRDGVFSRTELFEHGLSDNQLRLGLRRGYFAKAGEGYALAGAECRHGQESGWPCWRQASERL